jgi:hypothetical protein
MQHDPVDGQSVGDDDEREALGVDGVVVGDG